MADTETGAPAEDRTPSESERTRVIERAAAELHELCHGKRWQMRIPVDEASDSDVAFGELIRLATRQSAENARLTAALDGVREDAERLKRFAGAAIVYARDCDNGKPHYALLHRALVACGLVERMNVTEPCGPDCWCSDESRVFPLDCYRESQLGLTCVNALCDTPEQSDDRIAAARARPASEPPAETSNE